MPVEIRVPQLGESISEATVLRWLKKEGEAVQAGEPVVELETDKVNVEVPAEGSGVLAAVSKREGETVLVGEVIGLISGDGARPAEPAPPRPAAVVSPAQPAPPAHVSPVARRLAEENGIDLRQVRGSGPGGKITKEDVAVHIERTAQAPATAKVLAENASGRAAPPPPAPPAAAVRPAGEREERIRMSRRRQTIAARLQEALRTAAMLTTFNEIDMSAVMEIRKRRRDAFKERHGVGLGFMSFFTKATVAALQQFPYLNAEIQGDEILLKRHYDIGIAVSTDEGLVVPVLRDADRKSFADIEREIMEMAGRAREGRLTLADLQGGTFTITNGGVFGSLMSTPILNPPQVGILGMHKIEERPVVAGGQIVVRPMMYVALSYDHRIVDGREAVGFLVRVKELVEDPALLLIES